MKYCVCGKNGVYALSDDLQTWVVYRTASTKHLYDVIRGPDRYVIIGNGTEIIVEDGKAPVVYNSSTLVTYPWRGCYANNLYWRVTNTTNTIQKSVDGIVWTDVVIPLNGRETLSISGSGQTLIVGGNSGTAAVSTDGGNSWKAMGLQSSAIWLTGINNGRIYIGEQFAWIAYSDNPYSAWTYLPGNALAQGATACADMAFSPLCGLCPGSADYLNRTVDGGNSWLPGIQVALAASLKTGIIFDSIQFVAVGKSGEIVTISPDGLTFTKKADIRYGTPLAGVPLYGISCSNVPGMPNMFVPRSDSWNRVTSVYVPHNGSWKRTEQIYVPLNGEWTPIPYL